MVLARELHEAGSGEVIGHVARPREPDRALATVLFTDIVPSTPRASELGDRGWRQLLADHERLTRAQLERNRGHEVKTMGDGFLATFDGPARGCAAPGRSRRPC